MKRKSIKIKKTPGYPNYQELEKEREILTKLGKTLSMGAAAVAFSACQHQQPPEVLGGVPLHPKQPKELSHSKETTKTSELPKKTSEQRKEESCRIPLGGVKAPPQL